MTKRRATQIVLPSGDREEKDDQKYARYALRAVAPVGLSQRRVENLQVSVALIETFPTALMEEEFERYATTPLPPMALRARSLPLAILLEDVARREPPLRITPLSFYELAWDEAWRFMLWSEGVALRSACCGAKLKHMKGDLALSICSLCNSFFALPKTCPKLLPEAIQVMLLGSKAWRGTVLEAAYIGEAIGSWVAEFK